MVSMVMNGIGERSEHAFEHDSFQVVDIVSTIVFFVLDFANGSIVFSIVGVAFAFINY